MWKGLKKAAEKAAKIVEEKANRSFDQKTEINVMMIGGRRAGKTSVLASMDTCCMTTLAGVDGLHVTRDADSGIALDAKQTELKRYFTKQYMKQPQFIADLAPSEVDSTYGFDIVINNKDVSHHMRFQDIPGEWVRSGNEHEQEVQEMVNRSQVIIIAIDTPHMVEQIQSATGYGKYHMEFNRVSEITRFFKRAFQNSKEDRLVLLVPLKCEKYFHRNGKGGAWSMALVEKTVEKGYSELIEFLTKSDVKEFCTVAVTPILTLGGAEFDSFDENGYAGVYCYVEDMALRRFEPKYCEQPLFLTLQYVIAMALKVKNKKGRIPNWFRERFGNQATLQDLIQCRDILSRMVVMDETLGFKVLNDSVELL